MPRPRWVGTSARRSLGTGVSGRDVRGAARDVAASGGSRNGEYGVCVWVMLSRGRGRDIMMDRWRLRLPGAATATSRVCVSTGFGPRRGIIGQLCISGESGVTATQGRSQIDMGLHVLQKPP
ncbi:Os02g0717250 [Oryza sativa Japonica Group]|uniref:Uncharacterized protein n=3 Tax=Oryza sativa TaxID=4530 RepID=A0A0P0VNV2_ORYSJ|nr:hypothetical protein OsI_08699 [Oryza sativa Indica Group]BAD09182.1 hypothetical protein [Oryza sativa Japonica Group]BAD12893.1 hypothetical protein [Oryza sativa Japonica Group]BAS80619.1 Os02g0717250 [Oryza sativa Japonica Group]